MFLFMCVLDTWTQAAGKPGPFPSATSLQSAYVIGMARLPWSATVTLWNVHAHYTTVKNV